jgi:cytochrome o ubiquinol oxidase subunit III
MSGEAPGVAKTTLGFWVYLMTDLVLFATLFATYAVLRLNTFGGPGAPDLFDLPFILVETLVLLVSSFTAGLAVLAAGQGLRKWTLAAMAVTALLGGAFLTMELTEFAKLVAEGNSWQRSGFLSAFFTLVGTHGAHIAVGLLWVLVLMVRLVQRGLTPVFSQRLLLFSMFWHFLDLVWIFIFTLVYLMGVV